MYAFKNIRNVRDASIIDYLPHDINLRDYNIVELSVKLQFICALNNW